MCLLEAYFDESGSHEGSPILAVAGYLFDRDNCLLLDAEWKAMLEEYSLPYFRMSACAHGNPPFDRLSSQQCIDVETKLIQIVRRYASFASAISMDEKDFGGRLTEAENPYAWCCWMSLIAIRKWADDTSFNGKIAYFFESGHAHQSTANRIMDTLFRDALMREQYRYASHAFIDKLHCRPVQAADLLAWLHANEMKRSFWGEKRVRKDLKALLDGTKYNLFHYNQMFLWRVEEAAAARRRGPAVVSGTFGHWRF